MVLNRLEGEQKMVRNSGLLVAFLLAAALVTADEGLGDWTGHLFINGNLTPSNADGVQICAYLGDSGTAVDDTTVGAEASGYYLLHAYGASGQDVSFRVFCLYPVNENPQDFHASPPTNLLNLTITHTTPPVITIISPLGTPDAGTLTMMVATDEYATCRYATTSTTYDSMSHETSWGTTHSWSISAPSSATTYTYYIRCVDHFGFVSNAKTLSFTTSGTHHNPPGGGGGSSGGSTGPGPGPTPTPTKQCSALGGACAAVSDCCNETASCLNYVCTAAPNPTPTPSSDVAANVTVPGTASVGSVVTLTVTDSQTGAPLVGVTVKIITPSGEEFSLITDANGTIRFRVSEQGLYTYDVLNYREVSPKSTNAQVAAATPTPVAPTPRPSATPFETPAPTPAPSGPNYLGGVVAILAVMLAGCALVVAYLVYRWTIGRKQ